MVSLIRFNKQNAKRVASLMTAGIMVLSAGAVFTGCGKSSSSNEAIISQEEAMKSLSYKINEVPVDYSLYGSITYANGLYYGAINDQRMEGENYFNDTRIVVFDAQGVEKLNIPIFIQEDPEKYGGISGNGNIMVDDKGNISCLTYVGGYDPATDTYESTEQLVTFDSTGKEINRIDASKLYEVEPEDYQTWLSNIIVDKNGNLILNLSSYIQVCDSNGNVLFKTDKIDNQNSWINGLFLTNEGVPAICYYEYSENMSESKIVEIDVEAKGFGKEYKLEKNVGMVYDGSGDYLCYFSSETGIFGIRADNLAFEPVLNLLNLGVNSNDLNSFTINSDGSFTTVSNEYGYNKVTTILTQIIPVDPSEVKARKAISLGCFYLDWNIRSRIAEFNKTNEEYVICTTTYSETNDTTDYEAALTNFNNELLAGKVPDIILLSPGMPIDSYTSKGLFADLYELMETGDITKDAFIPNIIQAFETDGKLYKISPTITIQSCGGKASVIGTDGKLSLEKAEQLAASLGEGATLFNNDIEISSDHIIDSAVQYSEFIDYKNGTCHFDTPEFKAILELAKKYPAEIDYEKLYNDNPDYWMTMEGAVRDNKALLSNLYFSTIDDYMRYRYVNIGEEMSVIGYPGAYVNEGSSVNCFQADTMLAISDKSQFKDGAWEFITQVLNDTVTEEPVTYYDAKSDKEVDTGKTQYINNYYGVPLLSDQFDKLMQQALVPKVYYDENGKEVEWDNTYYIGNEEIKIPAVTQADVDAYKNIILSTSRLARYNESVIKIIKEETTAFLNGTKSADETASMIQSRVSLFMSEQY